MKCPSLIPAVEADLDAGRSAVVQLVSTGEALMERRIAEIPASEWGDLNIDLTPGRHPVGSVAKFGAEVVNWLRRLERGIGG